MLRKLNRIGNSRGLIFDRTLLGLLGIKRDDEIILTVKNNRIIIERAPPLDEPLPRRAFVGDLRGVPSSALPSRREIRESERLAAKALRNPNYKNIVK